MWLQIHSLSHSLFEQGYGVAQLVLRIFQGQLKMSARVLSYLQALWENPLSKLIQIVDWTWFHADLIFWELLAFFGSWSYSKPEKAENQISNFTSYFVLQFLWLFTLFFFLHLRAHEKEIATHSSVLAWRIPGMGEPGGLLSLGSHRVGHDWSDLAAAVIILELPRWC